MFYRSLRLLALTVAIGLSSCERSYTVSQRDLDSFTEGVVDDWVDRTDKFMEAKKLIREGQYQEAETTIDIYLRRQVREAQTAKLEAARHGVISSDASGRINSKIEEQTEKIEKLVGEQ